MSNPKMRVYIAGPMRGIPQYNAPAFREAKIELTKLNLEPVSPLDLDEEQGFDFDLDRGADYDWSQWPAQSLDLHDTIRRDVDAVLSCDAIVMLPGWETSKGARAEMGIAVWAGKFIYTLRAKTPSKLNLILP